MKKIWIVFSIFLMVIFLSNCTDSSNTKSQTILYPNNDSELTLLMREMFTYYENLKLDIERGTIPDKVREFKEIHSAVATEPSKSESPLYKAMSTVYLESAKKLQNSKDNMPEVFNNMVDNCMNCHKQMCPGPMVKIKKLYLASAK
ncbi:MAG: hypothetical protein AAGA77_17515 [Bacteroidota bacterium]